MLAYVYFLYVFSYAEECIHHSVNYLIKVFAQFVHSYVYVVHKSRHRINPGFIRINAVPRFMRINPVKVPQN
jgi:hypothetical protein